MSQRPNPRIRTLRLCAALAGLAVCATGLAIWQFPRASRASPTLAAVDNIFQADAVVGFGIGAKFDPRDPGQIEFAEITNASRLDFRKEFEFQKYILKLSRVYEVKDVAPSSPAAAAFGDNRTL